MTEREVRAMLRENIEERKQVAADLEYAKEWLDEYTVGQLQVKLDEIDSSSRDFRRFLRKLTATN